VRGRSKDVRCSPSGLRAAEFTILVSRTSRSGSSQLHIVREPGPTGSQWRIHYSLRLPTLECDYFDLTPTQGVDIAERFGRFRFQAGELLLADAGYCHPGGIVAVFQQEADVCVRMNPYALPLWNERGKPFPLLKPLAILRQAGELAEWPVWVQSGQVRMAGRICAIRKSREAIERAQRRLGEKL
jgi:hypothetical protein